MTSITVPYRSNRPLRGCACHARQAPHMQPQAMSGLGLSLLSKFLKISQPGPNEFKLQTTPSEVKKVIAVAGPALSVFGPWGKVAAVGAAVITAADQRQKVQALNSAAASRNAQDLIGQYQQIAGQIPGRVIGLPLINQIWAALVSGRANATDAGYVINSCAKCTAGTVKDQVAKAMSQGVTNPVTILDQFLIPEMQRSNKKGTWTIPTNDLERQILIDAIDATEGPNAPLTYGAPAPDQPGPTAAPAPTGPTASLPQISSQPIGFTDDANALPVFSGSDGRNYVAQNGQWVVYSGAVRSSQSAAPVAPPIVRGTPVTLPATPTSPAVTVTAPTTVAPDQTAALIKQLMDQGASQQQALAAAIANLQSQGVNTSAPAVQQQLASDVKAATEPAQAGLFGNVPPALIALGVGLTALSFFFAHRDRRTHK